MSTAQLIVPAAPLADAMKLWKTCCFNLHHTGTNLTLNPKAARRTDDQQTGLRLRVAVHLFLAHEGAHIKVFVFPQRD